MTDLDLVLASIHKVFDPDHLPRIQCFLRQPSVSATGEGIQETAEYLCQEITELGAKDVHLVPVPEGEFGHPQVYGELIEDPQLPTMLFYAMYDVQPTDGEPWEIAGNSVDPFGGEIHEYEWVAGFRGKCLISRGAMNTKTPTQAFLNVIRTIRELGLKLPVNLIFVIEGEEELGSIHLESFIERYQDKLRRAEFLYFPFFSERYDGLVTPFLGTRGIISMRIQVDGDEWGAPSERDVHSAYSGVIQNPIFKMAGLLNSLKNDDTGEVLVPGVMNDPDLLSPDENDSRLLEELAQATNWDNLRNSFGVRKFRKRNGRELVGLDFYVNALFKPGLSVNGISGGYVGDGMKTIIPKRVSANLDIRLPPFQKPEKVRQLYQEYICSTFPMARVSFRAGYPPAKIGVNNPYVLAMIRAMQASNKKVIPQPLIAGSAPFALFQYKLGLPYVIGGVGHGGRQHSTNEYAVLESEDGHVGGVRDFEYCLTRFLYGLPRRSDSEAKDVEATGGW